MTFGRFSFESASGELRRDGVPLKLAGQPAAVLRLLLASPGRIVSRDEMKAALWGDDTNVDFERSLNVCIAQLRMALGESAEKPVFIKTHPKKGYEFIAPISMPIARRRWWWAMAAGVVVAGVVAVARRAGKPVVAISRFDNETGDASLDRLADSVADGVVADLTEAGHEVIGNAAILRGPRNERDPARIGEALGVGYVILCQLQNASPGYRLLAHLIRLPEQTHLKVVRIPITPKEAASGAKRIADEFGPRLTA